MDMYVYVVTCFKHEGLMGLPKFAGNGSFMFIDVHLVGTGSQGL